MRNIVPVGILCFIALLSAAPLYCAYLNVVWLCPTCVSVNLQLLARAKKTQYADCNWFPSSFFFPVIRFIEVLYFFCSSSNIIIHLKKKWIFIANIVILLLLLLSFNNSLFLPIDN